MRKLSVGLGERSYDILVEQGLLGRLEDLLRPLRKPGAVLVTLTDENVWRHYADAYRKALGEAEPKLIVIPPGEASKSMAMLERVYTELAAQGLRRDGLLCAFGGGVVGDLCGFAAATYLRGVPFVQIPTTLLSQVDSSVGGKTAINMPFAKNSVGAFYQPKLVITDPDTLATLPLRERRSGMAEVIKHSAIYDKGMFAALQGDITDWAGLIADNCAIKSAVVARDELDRGERMLLNFGHSFGHGAEKHYGGVSYNHGEAVAVGMIGAALIGEYLGKTKAGTAEALRSLFTHHGLDGRLPCPLEEIWKYLEADKKSEAASLRLVLLKEVGEAFIAPMTYEALKTAAREVESAWRS